MKNIEERAEEHAAPALRLPDDEMINKSQLWLFEKQSFIAGAQSGHEELTRWNKSDVLPEDKQWIITKVVNENNGVLYYETTKFYSEYFNELEERRHTLLGWRKIHEQA